MKTKKFLFIFLFLILLSSIVPIVGLGQQEGQGLVPCGNPGQAPCQLCHFFLMFKNIFDFILFRIVPIVAVFLVAIGGFMFVFAYTGVAGQGETMLNQAKELFKAVIIGIVIIYSAWLLINLFFMLIGVAEWTKLENGWFKIEIDCSTDPI